MCNLGVFSLIDDDGGFEEWKWNCNCLLRLRVELRFDNSAFVLALKMLCRGSADFAPQRS